MSPQSDRQRYHRTNTAKAMRSMISSCPHCQRRGNFRKHWLPDAMVLLWRCHYCAGEWTAESRPQRSPSEQDEQR